MKHFHKYLGWLALAGCSVFVGEGKLFVWNGTERPVIAVVDGRTEAELPLRPNSGALLEATAGDYTITLQRDDGSERRQALTLAADQLAVLSVDAASCFARADISGMYQEGKPRVLLTQAYPPAELQVIDSGISVFPGEAPPAEKPRHLTAFLRLYAVPCALISDESALREHLRTLR